MGQSLCPLHLLIRKASFIKIPLVQKRTFPAAAATIAAIMEQQKLPPWVQQPELVPLSLHLSGTVENVPQPAHPWRSKSSSTMTTTATLPFDDCPSKSAWPSKKLDGGSAAEETSFTVEGTRTATSLATKATIGTAAMPDLPRAQLGLPTPHLHPVTKPRAIYPLHHLSLAPPRRHQEASAAQERTTGPSRTSLRMLLVDAAADEQSAHSKALLNGLRAQSITRSILA